MLPNTSSPSTTNPAILKGYSIKKCRGGGTPSFFLGLSDVCLRGLKCTKRGSLKKRGGFVFEKKRGCGGSVQEKKEGPGGSAKREKRGGGGVKFRRGGLPPPHIF